MFLLFLLLARESFTRALLPVTLDMAYAGAHLGNSISAHLLSTYVIREVCGASNTNC